MMRRMHAVVVLSLLAGCGSDTTGRDTAETDGTADGDGDVTADTQDSQTLERCAELARIAAKESRAGGTSEAEAGARFLATIQSCITPSWSSQRNAFAAAINADYREAAGRFISKSLAPKAYARLRQDRARKAASALGDDTLLAEIAEGDEDADRVPDSRDQCPRTPPMKPTDDAGCPQEGDPELTLAECTERMAQWHEDGEPADAAPPYECLAYEAIDDATIMHHPECDGAPTPSIPVPANQYPSPAGAYTLSQVTNQPDGCPVMYEVQVWAFFDQVARNWSMKEAFSGKDDQDPNGDVARFLVGAGHPKPDDNHVIDQEHDRTYRWRARAANGNGQLSLWSDWVGRFCPSHDNCKD